MILDKKTVQILIPAIKSGKVDTSSQFYKFHLTDRL